MPRIFISHDSADAPVARRLVDDLEAEGLACWIAPRDIPPGTNYGDAISNGITDAGALVFLLSAESIKSQFCMKEVEYATSLRTTVIPVRLDATELTGGLRLFLAGNQWVEASSDQWSREIALSLAHLRTTSPSTPADGEADAPSPTSPPPTALQGSGTIELDALTVEDCRRLLASMKFDRDPRNAPEGRRRGRFKSGWRSAVDGRVYADRTLVELKWDNLGWRLGDQFGARSDDVMDSAFEAFADTWFADHA